MREGTGVNGGAPERMGDGKVGVVGGEERLTWIRRVLIETGEKGQTLGVGAHTSKLTLNIETHTHTHTLSQPRSTHTPHQCNTSLFRHSLMKDGQVQHQEAVA